MLKTELFTVKEVANLFKFSEQKIRQLIKNGEIEAIKISSSYRIPEEAIRKILKGGGNGEKSSNKKKNLL